MSMGKEITARAMEMTRIRKFLHDHDFGFDLSTILRLVATLDISDLDIKES